MVDLAPDDGYNAEDVLYWAYVNSRLPQPDNIFWNFVRAQEEQMALLQMMVNAGQLNGVTFLRND